MHPLTNLIAGKKDLISNMRVRRMAMILFVYKFVFEFDLACLYKIMIKFLMITILRLNVMHNVNISYRKKNLT